MHVAVRINNANQPELRVCWGSENRIVTIAVLIIGSLLWFSATPVLAAIDESSSIEWTRMGIQLFGGLALFLFGMEQMGSALRIVAGDRMRAILSALTNNRVFGLLTGLAVTAIIQSSSITTVMLVGSPMTQA